MANGGYSTVTSQITQQYALNPQPNLLGPNAVIGAAINSTYAANYADVSVSEPPDVYAIDANLSQHRRLYRDDLIFLSSNSNLLEGLVRNRVVVSLPKSVYGQSQDALFEQYAEWLDAHNAGLYHLNEVPLLRRMIVSFEIEADMVQFILAFS